MISFKQVLLQKLEQNNIIEPNETEFVKFGLSVSNRFGSILPKLIETDLCSLIVGGSCSPLEIKTKINREYGSILGIYHNCQKTD